MENLETLESFEAGITHFEKLFRIKPEAFAYDLHPNYLASRYVLERVKCEHLPAIAVQHHHAHIVSCMAEHSLRADDLVIGVAFDGTGYGGDGAIWGGEFLLSNYQSYQRVAHLRYIPLPGGDLAVREPWRVALAYLFQLKIDWAPDLYPVSFGKTLMAGYSGGLDVIANQIAREINAPMTSSMGRLFDAVASLAGLRQTVNYEAQAAIELEAVSADFSRSEPFHPYEFDLNFSSLGQASAVIDPAPLFNQILVDLRSGHSVQTIATRFHSGIAYLVLEVCRKVRQNTGCNRVALSGGVWQNVKLLEQTVRLLESGRFIVYTHHKVPPNDGGLALGQALSAYHRLTNPVESGISPTEFSIRNT